MQRLNVKSHNSCNILTKAYYLKKGNIKLDYSERKIKFRGSVDKSRVKQEHFLNEQLYLVPKLPNQTKEESNRFLSEGGRE